MNCTHKSSIITRPLYTIFMAFVFFLTAAGCTEPEIDNENIVETEAIYFEPIGLGSSSAFNAVTEKAIYDADTWNDYQQYMETVLPFRDVDFSQLMVVFVAVPAHTGGVTVQIESVEIGETDVVVSYVLGQPGEDCRVMDIPSAPFQAVMLRRLDGPFRFEHRTEPQPCTLR